SAREERNSPRRPPYPNSRPMRDGFTPSSYATSASASAQRNANVYWSPSSTIASRIPLRPSALSFPTPGRGADRFQNLQGRLRDAFAQWQQRTSCWVPVGGTEYR